MKKLPSRFDLSLSRFAPKLMPAAVLLPLLAIHAPAAQTTKAEAQSNASTSSFLDSSDPSMAAFRAAISNTPAKLVRVALIGDGFWTCGGSTIPGDCPAVLLQQTLQTNFGNAGSGFVDFNSPTGYLLPVGVAISTEAALGPAQCANPSDNGCATASSVGSLYRLPAAAGATFGTSSIRVYGNTLKLYGATYSDSQHGLAVSLDGAAATSCFAGTTSVYTPAVCTISSTGGWHYVTISGPTSGAGYLYGAEWLTGSSGVVIDNYAHGHCMTSCFGENTATELAYITLVGTPSLVIHMEAVDDIGNGISTSVSQSQYKNQLAYFAALTPAPSQMLIDQSNEQSSGVSTNQALFRPVEQALAASYDAAYLSMAESWGSWSNSYANGLMSPDGVHPSAQGYRALIEMIAARILPNLSIPESQGTYIDSATQSVWQGNVPPNVDNGQAQVVDQTAFGIGACSNSFAFVTGWNSCFGENAGIALSSGEHNALFGRWAGGSLLSGNYDSALGDSAGFGTTTSGSVQLGAGTNSINNTQQFQNINYLSGVGHIYIQPSPGMLSQPFLSVCGATPSLSADASDTIGTVKIGAGAASCVLNFAHAFTAPAPHCVVSSQTFSLTAYSETTTTLKVIGTGTFDYHCLGR